MQESQDQPMDEVFIVRVRRSGGVAGMSRTGQLELRSPVASSGAEPWLPVAHAALEQLRALPRAAGNSGARDAFSWFLSFNGEVHLLSDAQLTGPARELAEHVIRAARGRAARQAGTRRGPGGK